MWYPIEEKLPETSEWVNVMTQDGSVFPATYNEAKKTWVPVFRGGSIESLMHGKVAFWCERPEGYPFIRCDKGHGYLKTPDNDVCPTCKRFGFFKTAKTTAPAEVAETEEKAVDVAETAEKPKPKKTRKKAE